MSRNDTLEPSKKSRGSGTKNCWPIRYEIEEGVIGGKKEKGNYFSLEICDF
jgi:hypothetical protein